MRTPAAVLALIVILSGCATIVRQSYSGRPPGPGVRLSGYSGTTEVYSSVSPGEDGSRLEKDGYVEIGVSSFRTSGHVTFGEIEAQAREAGADIVLFSMTKPGSRQPIQPVVTNDDGTPRAFSSYVHVGGSLTAFSGRYGDSGMVGGGTMDFNGSVTSSEIPGVSSREMAFINAQAYQYTASFWRKRSS
jgi:hypothetical protein